VISCLIVIFIDPLFFFLSSVEQDNKCIVLNWNFAMALAAVRSVTNAIYSLHMLLQISAASLLLIQIRFLHFVTQISLVNKLVQDEMLVIYQ